MSERIVIFESPDRGDVARMRRYLRRKWRVMVVERFHAYHHEGRWRWYPPLLPAEVEQWLRQGRVDLLPAKDLKSWDIYSQASDKAVQTVEAVWPQFRLRHRKLIDLVNRAMGSDKGDCVLRKGLCDKLGNFYSLNIMLGHISRLFEGREVTVYFNSDLRLYLSLRRLVGESGIQIDEHENIRFSRRRYARALIVDWREKLLSLGRIAAEWAAGCRHRLRGGRRADRRSYRYGIAIVSPGRQFRGDRRGADFLVDDQVIKRSEVVFIPLLPLTAEQRAALDGLGCAVYDPPQGRGFVGTVASPAALLWAAMRSHGAAAGVFITLAYNAVLVYARWKKAAEEIELGHFISYADFHPGHIARNIALHQAGTQTWYYHDSMNNVLNYVGRLEGCRERHPLWSYLNYNHFVVWYRLLADWFDEYPSLLGERPVVGCLWASHVMAPVDRDGLMRSLLPSGKDARGKFLVVAYTSTYTVNRLTGYDEGIAFAEHLRRLAAERPDVFVVVKEKKMPELHLRLSPELGPRLLEVYDELNRMDNAQVLARDVDASSLMAAGDAVVSFPFTSTTFEALSANRPAIWHDPLDRYRHTFWARAEGVMTHGFDELCRWILHVQASSGEPYSNPIPAGSPLLDPFRDGRAIERFRELLASAQ
ncbi:MAG: polysaccharide biosynthesis PFTS motif protein [Planctomycetes bacterium]|nr:polysaccharide biosynthesis PFTS motif protein [Planctomycetota bacterium]